MPADQKEQLTKIRDEAQGAIQADDIEKLREIVGKLEDAAAMAARAQAGGAAQGGPAPEQNQNAGSGNDDNVVDADFTDK